MLKVLDLFSGMGGFTKGLDACGGFETAAFCELEEDCREVLESHWPGRKMYDDITKLTVDRVFQDVGQVDVITGGFPCQDISSAGKGAGLEGSRSGLWFHMHRLIAGLRPRWVLIENSPNLRTRGADRVLAGLEAEGYSVWPTVVGACDVGAPHERDRTYILGHTELGNAHSVRLDAMYQVGNGLQKSNVGTREPGKERRGAVQSAGTDYELANGTGRGCGTDGSTPGIAGHLDQCNADVPDTAGERPPTRPGHTGEPCGSGCGRSESDRRPCGRCQDDRSGVGHADAGGTRLSGRRSLCGCSEPQESLPTGIGPSGTRFIAEGSYRVVAGRGTNQHDWEEPRLIKWPVGATIDGIPVKSLRRANKAIIKMAGNSVVWPIVTVFGRFILKCESGLVDGFDVATPKDSGP